MTDLQLFKPTCWCDSPDENVGECPCSCHTYVPTFDEWYARFPRKQGKAAARKRWAKMSGPERASAWAALPGWERFAAEHPQGTTFVPYASTWLNQSRWEDDAPVAPRPERRVAPGMSAVRALLA